ncbi:GspE/PulE family protein [Desulfonatronum sp. SC1]|uniref:GspE/PulE family protein n=1 Tax=Desulfonatronum sp. SC1 TaxID=2109626 RepID=UPI000D30E590|nr:GspE/PulE family protein [Desulfonatronum sp. SC1]PTN34883.1 type II/IV secretion system protein [Desulfonatronum sp. SC1]
MTEPIRIGDLLKSKGYITETQLRYALQVQRVTKEKLGKVLLRIGLASELSLARILSQQLNLELVDMDKEVPDLSLLPRFNKNSCMSLRIFPIRVEGDRLITATSELPDQRLEQAVFRGMGLRPSFVIAEDSKLVSAIYKYFYFLDNPVEKMLEQEAIVLAADSSQTVSLDNFLTHLLLLAVKRRASDVHIRPMDQGLSVAFRVDGVLVNEIHLQPQLRRLISAIKLQAGMNISEQRLPQDGRWSVTLLEQKYDIRTSSIITPFGENMVMRLLPQERASQSLDALGFLPKDVERMNRIFEEPFGIILLSGPTGAGKTTTLVAGLTSLDLLGKNVLTVENPVEYLVPLARQTQVNLPAGYDFADAMPSFLRHDPDVILIGEIRDEKTAKTALNAALTGHLVLSTLHSNTALGALPRLRGLGMDNLALSESLNALVSQRLLRTVCPHCIEEYEPSQEEIDYLQAEPKSLVRGNGCTFCNRTGYFGRTLTYEIIIFTREFRLAVQNSAPPSELMETARKHHFQDMFEIARFKILQHMTTVREVQRVLGVLRKGI